MWRKRVLTQTLLQPRNFKYKSQHLGRVEVPLRPATALVAGSAIGGVLYLVTAKLLRVSEVETMVSTLTKRLLPRAG